jgi:hypothetical protein
MVAAPDKIPYTLFSETIYAFHPELEEPVRILCISFLLRGLAFGTAELLGFGQRREPPRIQTLDSIRFVLLRFILGDDFEKVSFHFDFLFQEKARDIAFAYPFRALGKLILQIIDRRRKDPATSTDALGLLMQARPAERPINVGSPTDRRDSHADRRGSRDYGEYSELGWYPISQNPEV